MSEHTNISWTDCTWNPWRGCTKVSPGCKNCYASDLVNRFGGDFSKRVRAKDATFNAPLKWNREPIVCDLCGVAQRGAVHMDEGCFNHACPSHDHHPSKSTYHLRRVFFGSLMDFLDPEVPVEWLADALDIVRRCPDLVFQMVTKRPELFTERLIAAENTAASRPAHGPGEDDADDLCQWIFDWWNEDNVPPNVWIITSVEDQARADERIPHLIRIPAAVRGLSVEPLLEHVELFYEVCSGCGKRGCNSCPCGTTTVGPDHNGAKIDWVIVGGESGPHRRDCGVDAIVDVAEQCQSAGVPVFVKQDCALHPGKQGRIPDEIWNLKQFPSDAR